METLENNLPGDDDLNDSSLASTSSDEAVEDDGTPVLDEEDLEENDLSVEEAEQIEWEEPKTGSSGSEEKDITD
jgi:hypothetical protein